MNKDEIEGKAKELKGRFKQGVGDVANDENLRDEGVADEAEGNVQKNFGTAKRKVDSALRRLKRATRQAEAFQVVASLDGRDISGRYLMLEALNLHYVGPNMRLALEGQPGDGQFEVVLVTEDERTRFVQYLDAWQENRERLAILPSHRGKRLHIEWTGFPLHIDDKLYPKKNPEPKEIAGVVDAAVSADSVEFLMPK